MLALRKWLFSGLLVIVPLFITLAVLKWIIDTLDQTLWVLPGAWQRWLYDNNIRGLGVLLTLAILLVVGAIASNFVGKRLLGWGDAVVRRIPVVRSIYSSVKQVSDTLFSENGNAFAQRCWCSGPVKGSGPSPSSPAPPAPTSSSTSVAATTSASTCRPRPTPRAATS
jgi:uncharacterized membrane protein